MRWILISMLLASVACSGPSRLMRASMDRDAETIERVLSDPRQTHDLEERDHRGRTILMVAILNSPEDVGIDKIPSTVQMLLDHGADVNSREPETGLTPLRCAIERSYPAVVSALVLQGAQVGKDDLRLARTRFNTSLEDYVWHYLWLHEETGLTELPVMSRAKARLHRAERVINHLQTVPSPSFPPYDREEPPEEAKPKQLREPENPVAAPKPPVSVAVTLD